MEISIDESIYYISADRSSKSGFSSMPCAEPVTVYGIAGEENIRKKLAKFFEGY